MVIYKTQLGDRELNFKALEIREIYKPLLKGVSCHICRKDTVVTWNKNTFEPIINACCANYEKKVLECISLIKA